MVSPWHTRAFSSKALAPPDRARRELYTLVPEDETRDLQYVNVKQKSASALQADIDRGTVDIYKTIGSRDHLHGFYAIQDESCNEPLAPTVGDTIPDYRDKCPARRQLLTVAENHVLGSKLSMKYASA